MPDAIPEGFITLKEAFEAHYKRKYGAAPGTLGDLCRPASHHSTFQELTRAFQERELDALVRDGATPEGRSRVQHWWHEGEFQERVFMDPVLPGWSEFPGQTPFTREASFSLWSAAAAREFRKTDPASMPIWTYAMTVAWIAGRSFHFMREEPPNLASMIVGEEGDERLQIKLDANLELLQALQSGKLIATGVHVPNGRKNVAAYEWADLQWRGGKALEDQWQRKDDPLGIEYRDVQVAREEVFAIWPSPETSVPAAGVQDVTKPVLRLGGASQGAAASTPIREDAKVISESPSGQTQEASQPAATADNTQTTPSRARVTRNRSPQEQVRVMPFLEKLFPAGIPSRAEMTDAALDRRVSEDMATWALADPKNRKGPPHKYTILRAAGRK